MSAIHEATRIVSVNGDRNVKERTAKDSNVTRIFGSNVFNDRTMKERLPKDTYKALKETIDRGSALTLEVANVVANAMKDWAIEKGATHYTHWF